MCVYVCAYMSENPIYALIYMTLSMQTPNYVPNHPVSREVPGSNSILPVTYLIYSCILISFSIMHKSCGQPR